MTRPVYVAGVGMIPFSKPGASPAYPDMGSRAARLALADAGVDYSQIQQAYVGYVYGDSTCGQAALYEVGLTGIPIVNVNNNCTTGSTALFLARQAVEAGSAECVLALGFEEMRRGALASSFTDRIDPLQRFLQVMDEVQSTDPQAPTAAQLFGGAGRMHMQMYGTRRDTFARIALKARTHAARNPNAVFRDPLTLEAILESASVFDPLTRLQCCPPTCGAAAAIICSEDFLRRNNLPAAVRIAAQAMSTDTNSSFDERDLRKLVGYDMTRKAARKVYEIAGVGPSDIDVCELHDCFTANELITYEGLGFADEGMAERFILDEQNTYGGAVVTNPSGGLLSKGHPLGATGLAQCAELVWQLRGQAEARQVPGARLALQHNLGLGGACVVTLYEAPRAA